MSRACIELQKIMDQLADWQRRYGGHYVTVSVSDGYGMANSLDERRNPWHSLVHEYEKEPQTAATVRGSSN
ncbi:hypothetical protein [Enterocloster lavalensis]|uniref:hypothetical protein n=1 Tax=Enterocloster lavalensis TaxID=460384 RepID=UPI000D1ADB7A|nr:hypothetical protein [Enterocloster lavalensis]PST29779.1 hypothetical protein C7256_27850 [Enterocloster lavalensis]